MNAARKSVGRSFWPAPTSFHSTLRARFFLASHHCRSVRTNVRPPSFWELVYGSTHTHRHTHKGYRNCCCRRPECSSESRPRHRHGHFAPAALAHGARVCVCVVCVCSFTPILTTFIAKMCARARAPNGHTPIDSAGSNQRHVGTRGKTTHILTRLYGMMLYARPSEM